MSPSLSEMFPLSRYFTPEDLRRGAEWMRTENLSSLVILFIDSALLFVASFGRTGRALWDRLDQPLGREWRTGAAFLAIVALARNVVILPVSLFVLREQHLLGLSHEGLPSFLRRVLVTSFGMMLGGALLGAGLGAVRQRFPRRWWLIVGLAASVVLIADTVLVPLRAQMDFQVRPLPAGTLRTRLDKLLDEKHVPPTPLYVIDDSRYGTEANAWFTGLGPTRRIIVTDTLLAFGDEAVVGAIAHEIGHRRTERLPGQLAFACVGLFLFLGVLEWCLRFAARRGTPETARGIPFAMWMVGMIMLVLLPWRAARGRAEEREADEVEFSARHDYDAYIAEQVRIVRANAFHPDPPAFWKLLEDHPTPAERIDRALWYKSRLSQ